MKTINLNISLFLIVNLSFSQGAKKDYSMTTIPAELQKFFWTLQGYFLIRVYKIKNKYKSDHKSEHLNLILPGIILIAGQFVAAKMMMVVK